MVAHQRSHQPKLCTRAALIDLVADVLPEWIQFLSMAFALVLLLLNAMRAVLLKAETVASVA